MAILPPDVKFRKFSAAGAPLAGGKLYSYSAGTSTPKDTYTDNSGGTANTNPVILDANGEANVWLGSGSYKFVLKDAEDNLQWTVDNIAGEGSAAISSGVFASRPAASTALTGALYFATDNSRVYRCNGTTWDDVTLTFIPFFMSGLASEKPATLPAVQAGRVYLETDTGKFWRWDGGEWDDITSSVITPNLPSTLSKTLYLNGNPVSMPANANTTAYTYTVPANTVGEGRGIRIRWQVRIEAAGTGLISFRLKINNSILCPYGLSNPTDLMNGYYEAELLWYSATACSFGRGVTLIDQSGNVTRSFEVSGQTLNSAADIELVFDVPHASVPIATYAFGVVVERI